MPVSWPSKATRGASRRDAVLRLLGGENLGLVAKHAGTAPEELLRWKNIFVRAGSSALAAESEEGAVRGPAVAEAGAVDDEPMLDWGWEEQQLGWMVAQLSELLSAQERLQRL